ncbi:MAG: aldose 1-epimerase [Bacteroidia bacterium]|nr:aldose 1-epimerase [Bacteroidia bacterium]NNF31670.1 aldose 1-epimerase [Flavobacteriaceae bacterium]NNJ82219.1 aldose 1-epimerase [Flavobacteriaceae bacterium]NNK55184.1 aldose 1-epimerase [Flavobacteriaceae bacterium]NNM10179.1 aldose 1-epimerase [Flavobacteriaceae bacterium]
MTCNFVESEIPFYHFTDDALSCKIVPAFGGSIQELVVKEKAIIKGVSIDKEGFEKYKEFCNSAILFPFPNRVAQGSYTFGDKHFHLDRNDSKYGNAIHGFAFTQCPEVISQSDTSLVLRFTHTESPGYTFPYILELEYSISPNGLKLQFKVSNTGKDLMPFGLGWHPYFVTDDQEKFSLHFEADKKYLTNANMIPDHSNPVNDSKFNPSNMEVDNAYRLTNSQILLRSHDRELKLIVPEQSYLQLYNPIDKRSFAVEPMSCVPDAFNNKIGLKTLSPGSVFKWNIQLEFGIS